MITAQKTVNELAAEKALHFCQKNKGWVRICDIKEEMPLYYTFEELSKREMKEWQKAFGFAAKSAWEEFGTKKSRYEERFIDSEGRTFKSITQVPQGSGFMHIFKLS